MDEDSGRKREDDGAYSSEYSDEDFLEVVGERQPATTGQVAEAVGCHRSTALRRLRTLADEGEIRGESVGTTTVWAGPPVDSGRVERTDPRQSPDPSRPGL